MDAGNIIFIGLMGCVLIGLFLYQMAQDPPPRVPWEPFELDTKVKLPGPPFSARLRRDSRTGADGQLFTFIEFACAYNQGGRGLIVASEHWRGKRRLSRMAELDVGRWPYLVRTDDAAQAARFLSAANRELIEQIDVMHSGSFILDLQPGQIVIRAAAEAFDRRSLQKFCDCCYRLVHALRSVFIAVRVMDVELSREAVCRVCGTDVEGAAVSCGRCRTPHHADCWEYNGGCSVYACGGTSSA